MPSSKVYPISFKENVRSLENIGILLFSSFTKLGELLAIDTIKSMNS
nr:MAG TPA: hypothetical protein [Crassvirales sp.]